MTFPYIGEHHLHDRTPVAEPAGKGEPRLPGVAEDNDKTVTPQDRTFIRFQS